ncbi:hypothetical protein GW17_00012379 [Ensete ventricosum]|nr:hypothetical protein GW17_00012379 [Ensete ventricosum]RZS14004.1 hypothetical protein BHM03_00045652 [Ensete ventricosum]
MAKSYGDGDLWLPPEFLCADFFREGGERCIPCEFGLGSNPESPVESATTGPESDEEDYMKAITQQMARYFLRDDDKDASVTAPSHAKGGGVFLTAQAMVRSPQSALCTRSSLNKGGSLNGPTLVSSPLEQRSEETCDLLDEAPGQMMRLRRRGDLGLCDRRILGSPMTQSPAMSTACKSANAGCYDLGPILTHRQLQAAHVSLGLFFFRWSPNASHFHHLKRQQAAKQQLSAARGRQCKARDSSVGYAESRCGQPPDLSATACPPLRKPQQRPPGSGMRAVFLNSSGARKESAGTGVFLPGTAGNKLAPRKKTGFDIVLTSVALVDCVTLFPTHGFSTGCSTVLVPDRVVQVLNLRLEDFAAQPRFPGGFVLTHGNCFPCAVLSACQRVLPS